MWGRDQSVGRVLGRAGHGKDRVSQGRCMSVHVLLAPRLSGTSCYEKETRGDLRAAMALCAIRTQLHVTGLALTGGAFSQEFPLERVPSRQPSLLSDLSWHVSEESHQSHQDPLLQAPWFLKLFENRHRDTPGTPLKLVSGESGRSCEGE